MPSDMHDDGDDDKEMSADLGAKTRFKEFDCADCNANNPCEEPIGAGDEVLCHYCGTEFQVRVNDSGKMKLREL